MELNIRGEMEAAAAAMESEGSDFEPSQDASPASESEPTSESSEEAPAQDASPATEDAPAATDDSSSPPDNFELPVGGSIPVPRVRKILENARAKGRAEVEQQLQALAWAKEVDRAQAEEALRVYQFANSNPVEFYRAVTERLRSDPGLRAEVERIWQPAQQPAAEPKSDRPEPDVLLEDGRLVYSANQMEKLLEWKERLIEGQISQRLEPLEKERKLTAQMQRIEAESKRVYEDVVKWPGMADAENRKAVAEAMTSQRIPVDVAYRQVVLPKLTDTKSIEERVRKQVLAELKLKGRASTENPQRVVSSPETFKGKSIREILEATAEELGMQE